ncbi:MAG: S8 family serine peptidase [Burkholderiales bacterium]|nr:S8 family serine peptidase [Burkholderiales bacterium]
MNNTSIASPRAAGGVVGPQLASAPRFELYENLGLAVASVRASEVGQLQSVADALEEVHVLPPLELIRPEFTGALANIPAGVSWAIKLLKIDKLWERGLRGQGVVVGHLDTGVDVKHPSLIHAVSCFADVRSDGQLEENTNPRDSGQHGTHTAGLLCGSVLDGAEFGCAPQAQLASAIVIEGGDVARRVLRGLDWCVGKKVRIVNLSVGVPGFNPAFQPVMSALRARDVLAIVAVGNEGPNTSRSPGNYAEALSVGAIQPDGAVWPRSSTQSFDRTSDPLVPDIYAPGAEVWSTWPNGAAMMLSGTSMASPHVAGLAALLLQAAPNASAGDLEVAIRTSIEQPVGLAVAVPNAVRALESLVGV